MENNRMTWVDKLINKYTTDSTDNTDNSNTTNNKQSVNSVTNGEIKFYAYSEGSNQRVDYSYKELQHIFGKDFSEKTLRFIHEAKKYGEINFVQESQHNLF